MVDWKTSLFLIPLVFLPGCQTENDVVNKFQCGADTIIYYAHIYNTVQIGDQCWMTENLDVGTMIPGTLGMTDNALIEKYCYNNEPDSCLKFGGLYQWNEMMQYTTHEGARGICPLGWHLPADEDWNVLEGSVDSQSGIGDTVWSEYGYRGFDAGYNLRSVVGWACNGADAFGFSGLPAGMREEIGPHNSDWFHGIRYDGKFWTSTKRPEGNMFYHYLTCNTHGACRAQWTEGAGFSVRCLKDD